MTLNPHTLTLEGRHIIEASAGTGKTHTLTTLVLRLVIEKGLPLESVLLVTFTRAATAELVGRLRDRLIAVRQAATGGEPNDPDAILIARRAGKDAAGRANLALASLDSASVWTIHAFCARVLQRWPIETGSLGRAETGASARDAARRAVGDAWFAESEAAPPLLLRYARGPRARKTLQNLCEAVLDCGLKVLPDVAEVAVQQALDAATTVSQLIADLRKRFGANGQAASILFRSLPLQFFDAKKLTESAERLARDLAKDVLTVEGLYPLHPDTIQPLLPDDARVPEDPLFDAVREASDALQRLLPHVESWVVDLHRRVLFGAVDRLESARGRGETNAWGDLVRRARAAVRDVENFSDQIRAVWPVVLVDEFQDTDAVQWDLFHRVWGPQTTSFLIGDPKQAIYGFRGADVFTYLSASRTAQHRHELDVNYRSDPSLVAAVNAVFDRSALGGKGFIIDDIKSYPTRARPGAIDALVNDQSPVAPLEWWTDFDASDYNKGPGKPNWSDLPDRIATEIVALLTGPTRLQDKGESRPLRPSDIAVLVRTNDAAVAVGDALIRRHVPIRNLATTHILSQPIAPHAAHLFAALARPEDGVRLRSALLTPLLGFAANQVEALAHDESAWEEITHRFRSAETLFRRIGPLCALRAIIATENIAAHLLARPRGSRDLTDLLHMGEILQDEWTRRPWSPIAAATWFETQLGTKGGAGDTEESRTVPRAEGDDSGVVLVTIHRSKGLEYNLVILPDLPGAKGNYDPYLRLHLNGEAAVDLSEQPDPEVADAAADEALAEDVRTAYVAMTRARHGLRVVVGRQSRFAKTGLAWLLLGDDSHKHPSTFLTKLSSGGKMPRRLRDCFSGTLAGGTAVRPLAISNDAALPLPETSVSPSTSPPPPRPTSTWRVGSYSALVAAGSDERDVDRRALSAPSDATTSEVPLANFPAGASVGTIIHGVLETLDFQRTETLAKAVDDALLDGAVDSLWGPVLSAGLLAALQTPMGGDAPRLVDLAPSQRLNEMNFTLPVRAAGLVAEDLALVFQRHGKHEAADDLRMLSFPPLRGFLKGVIDLVFEFDGRWYVCDYKSNHLGARVADYSKPRMDAAMRQHHYVLQAMLYAVAIHRHLRLRLDRYDPEKHLGGLRYLFLRGMDPANPAGHGVWSDRPPTELIHDLSSLFGP